MGASSPRRREIQGHRPAVVTRGRVRWDDKQIAVVRYAHRGRQHRASGRVKKARASSHRQKARVRLFIRFAIEEQMGIDRTRETFRRTVPAYRVWRILHKPHTAYPQLEIFNVTRDLRQVAKGEARG